MWFRRDLRVHDLPALAGAAEADRIVPVFVFDDRLLKTGRFPSANRTRSCSAACASWTPSCATAAPSWWSVRAGPSGRSPTWPPRSAPSDVYFTADSSPWSRRRDQTVIDSPGRPGRARPRLARRLHRRRPVQRAHGRGQALHRVHALPPRLGGRAPAPAGHHPAQAVDARGPEDRAGCPSLADLGVDGRARPGRSSPARPPRARPCPPSCASRSSATRSCTTTRPRGTSRLSPYLRWGCLSPLELEAKASEKRSNGRRRVRPPAGLARLLRRGADALPARGRAGVPGALPRAGVGAPVEEAGRVEGGPHRLPVRGRGHAPAAGRGLDAQPRCGWWSARS